MRKRTFLTGLCALGLCLAAVFVEAGTSNTPPTPPTPPDNCDPVQGQMEITSIGNGGIHGTMTGDLAGQRHIQIVHVQLIPTPAGPVRLIGGHGVMQTANGNLRTRDRIMILPAGNNHPARWRSTSRVVNGTGDYAGLIGRIRAMGPFGPNAGPINYHGLLCTPPSPDPEK